MREDQGHTGRPYRDRNPRGLFEPDVVVPEQLLVAAAPSPEHLLMLSVLEAAWEDAVQQPLQSGSNFHARTMNPLALEAVAWFETDDPTWLFSFTSICAVLELDPGAIRDALRRRLLGGAKVKRSKGRRRAVVVEAPARRRAG